MIDWKREADENFYGLNSLAYLLITNLSGLYVLVFKKIFKKITKMHYYLVLFLVVFTIYLLLLAFSWFYFKFKYINYDGAFVFWLALMIFGRRYLPIWVDDEVSEDAKQEDIEE